MRCSFGKNACKIHGKGAGFCSRGHDGVHMATVKGQKENKSSVGRNVEHSAVLRKFQPG